MCHCHGHRQEHNDSRRALEPARHGSVICIQEQGASHSISSLPRERRAPSGRAWSTCLARPFDRRAVWQNRKTACRQGGRARKPRLAVTRKPATYQRAGAVQRYPAPKRQRCYRRAERACRDPVRIRGAVVAKLVAMDGELRGALGLKQRG